MRSETAINLSYEIHSDIEQLKCIPVILKGLSCICQVYKSDDVKREIIDSLECFGDIQRVFIDRLSDKMSDLDSLIHEISDSIGGEDD